MCWASHWPPPPCAISCASAASWRAWTSYSAHSLRSGFITEAGRQQVPLGDAMAMTGHASVATAAWLLPRGAAATLKAARLFDLAATEQPAAPRDAGDAGAAR